VTELDAIATPELRELVLFARARARPISADEVAGHFRIHRTVARSRLERLAAAGLLHVSFERRSGRSGPGAGRPAKVYGVPPETSAIEFPRRHLDVLVGHLIDAVPEPGREIALAEAGVAFAGDLAERAGLGRARGARSAAERTCAALGKLGFQAFVAESAEDGVAITTPTCPLRPLVLANPEAAAIDHGMWMGLLDAYLPRSRPCSVTCETEGCLDGHASCRVLLRFGADRPDAKRHS